MNVSTSPTDPAPAQPNALPWGELALSAADLAFETDRRGVLTRLLPGKALGHTPEALLGKSAAEMLLVEGQPLAPALFQTRTVARGKAVWLRDGRREAVRVRLDVAPAPGNTGGTCGIGIIIPADTLSEDISLARTRVLARISTTMRSAFPPRRGLLPALEAITATLSATSARIWNEPDFTETDDDVIEDGTLRSSQRTFRFDHHVGPETAALPRISPSAKRFSNEHSIVAEDSNGSLIVVRIRIRCAGTVVLRLHRAETGVWAEAEALLCYTALSAITSLLEFDVVMTETLRDSRFDFLTGELNENGFNDYVGRAIKRLAKDSTPATLMLVGIDGLGQFNETNGPDAGDHAVCALTRTLREIVRPRDVIGRINGDILAVWLETADQFTVSERANQICLHGLPLLLDTPSHLSLSVGFATRSARADETLASLTQRARLALRSAKMAGGNGWRFASDEI